MKIPPGTPLRVALAFGPHDVVPVGRLALDRGTAVLEYAPEFIASELTVNPYFERPGTALVRAQQPRVFDGLHGVFADSLPDAWGEELMKRRALVAGVDFHALTSLDRLAAVGHRGMGALTYEPDFAASDAGAIDLDVLAHEAQEVLEGRDTDVLSALEQVGGSSGGARPKVLVAMNDAGTVRAGASAIPTGFDAWIVKFRSSADLPDIGPLEAAYADMARAAGVEMSDTKLISAKRGGPGYFATKRFDRAPGGMRSHVLSVAGFLDVDWQLPSVDYSGLLKATRLATRNQTDVESMFRRMVFNVLAHNRDDHTKQHAFIADRHGRWALAPAYDLTFSRGPGGEHYMTVHGIGKDITRDAVATVAREQGISSATVEAIIESVMEAVHQFKAFARTYGVTTRTLAELTKSLDRQLATFAPPTRTART